MKTITQTAQPETPCTALCEAPAPSSKGSPTQHPDGAVGLTQDLLRATLSYDEHAGKQHYLGTFPTPEEAHVAYLAAKAKLHKFNPVPRD